MKELLAAVLSEDENGMLNLAFHLDDPSQQTARTDKLLSALAQAREGMEPAFASKMPLVSQVAGVNYPAWQWSMLPDASIVLNLRHPGLGWLSFRMPDATHLHQQLQIAIDQQKTLIDEE